MWGEDVEEYVPFISSLFALVTLICIFGRFKPSWWLNLLPMYYLQFSFLSFLTGPHGCIGKTMVIVEMKAVLV
jgi:hypothetical protein